jgi:hypothetical protein
MRKPKLMRLRFYDDTTFDEVPEDILDTFDGYSDAFEAAFANYPREESMQLVVAWGTTGDEDGEPGAVLVISKDHIVTGYVDMVLGEEDALADDEMEEDEEPWPDHQEPSVEERLAKMIAFYRKKTKAPYMVVHDADDTPQWLKQGFVHAAPPKGIVPDDAIEVLTWGELPMGIEAFLVEHGLSWSREQHRVGAKYQHVQPSFYLQVPMA